MQTSIIIPFQKGIHYLNDCLKSIEEQKVEDYEVLLICDHPTEDVASFLKTVEQKHLNCYFLEGNQTGVAAARNLGLEKAQGKYIYFLDSDDYLMEGVLIRLLSFVKKENADMVFGPIEKTWYKKSTFEETYILYEAEDMQDTPLKNMSVLNILMKKEILDKYHIRFKEELLYYSDMPFLMEVLSVIDKYAYQKEAWYIKRKHDDPINFPSLEQSMGAEREFLQAYKISFNSEKKEYSDYLQFKFCEKVLEIYRSEEYRYNIELEKFYNDIAKGLTVIHHNVIKKFSRRERYILQLLRKGKVKKAQKKNRFVFTNDRRQSKIQQFLTKYFFEKMSLKENWIVFESCSGEKYTGNGRYIYEYMKKNYGKKYKYIWSMNVPKKLELKKDTTIVKRFSLKYFYFRSRAKYHIYDMLQAKEDNKRDGMVYLQAWHGTPLKKLVFDKEDVVLREPTYKMEFYHLSREWDYILSDNAYSTQIFKTAFLIEEDKVIECGYPRNDILYAPDRDEVVRRLKQYFHIPPDKKVILYAPTWRNQDYDMGKDYSVELPLDFVKLQEKIGKDYVLLLHINETIDNDFSGCNVEEKFLYDVSDFDDIAQLYLISDICITDYSSVFFDYANLKRPILFFVYDYEQYKDILGGFYMDMEKEVPGPLLYTTEELIYAIRQIDGIEREYAERYHAFYNKYCMLDDGFAARRVVEKVFQVEKQ